MHLTEMGTLGGGSALVLLAVLILIAVRQVGGVRLQIWQIMLSGALAVLLAGEISPVQALKAIDLDVMIFLLGMFIVGEALYRSGCLFCISLPLFGRARDVDHLVLLILFLTGSLSALLMNDTLAIIGTPMVVHLAQSYKISPQLLLLSLAFGVTTGSAMSPIGNPQNLLIALHGELSNPFGAFLGSLALPTVVNLLAGYFLLRLFYHSQFRKGPLQHPSADLKDHHLAQLSLISLGLIALLVGAKILSVFMINIDLKLTYISVVSALPIMVFSPRRIEILKGIDWNTMIFFGAMFVLMESVWQSGTLQGLMGMADMNLKSISAILALSAVASQIVSNVPFVALYLPLLDHASSLELVALAAGSTIAGNMFILGAASNVIIIQNAEKQGETLTFWEFARIGIPLTAINLLIYYIFLTAMGF